MQVSLSSAIAERVHFLSVLDHYFAPGYATTRDAGALQLFRRGMLTYVDTDYTDGIQMLRAAVKLDPKFAQAHAYIAYDEAATPDPGLADPKALVEQEIAAAEAAAPGLPEAVMARAARQFYLDEDVAGAIKTLEPVTGQLGNSFNLHMVYGHMLRKSGQMEQAQRQYQAASELDPYNQLAAQHVMPASASRCASTATPCVSSRTSGTAGPWRSASTWARPSSVSARTEISPSSPAWWAMT